MIYPCQILLKNGSPSNCHCVECKHQIEKGTTSMVLLKTAPHRDNVTPNHQKLKLMDFEVSSEYADGLLPLRTPTLQRRREVSSSKSSARSSSLPIPISMDEQRHRCRELQDMAEAESFYANATWRMYRRITKYRMDHPLPDCYFNDRDEIPKHTDDHYKVYSDDATAATADPSIASTSNDSKGLTEKFEHDDFTNRPSQDKDIEDDDHCMMFELDLS
jgi:hypothetical protein